MKKTYDVTGMSCSACSAAIERGVRKLDGIEPVSYTHLDVYKRQDMACHFNRAVVVFTAAVGRIDFHKR